MSAAIELHDVTLVRRTQEELHYDFKRTVLDLVRGRRRRPRRRTVIDNLTASIGQGVKLAVIGANGSGKSTVLKLIAGVLRPTRGSVEVRGTVAPLIELGVGFEPELTLIDNVIFYGILLGHEEATVRAHAEAILEFAELTEMRDEPTKTLSSGMSARLGFAIATEWRPDILLLDEVLSVGDERFRRKCAARLDRFWDAHSTIVVVSHDLDYVVRTCERVIWVDHGVVRFDGAVAEGVEQYLKTVPFGPGYTRGEELLELARENQRGEILVRGLSPTEQGRKVYLIRDGMRHWVTHPSWYVKSGYAWENVLHVDDAAILEIPEGDYLT